MISKSDSFFVSSFPSQPIIPRGVAEQLIEAWFGREQIIGLHSMLQCLQMGFAPNEPAVADRGVLAADMERAMALLLRSPTTTIADLVYGMILEFVRAYGRKGTIRLFWTNSPADWSDLINGSTRDLLHAMSGTEHKEQAIYVHSLQLRLILDVLAEERSSDASQAPNSLHQSLLNNVSTGEWKSFVIRIFKLLSPPKKEEEDVHNERPKRGGRRPKATAARAGTRGKRGHNAMDADDESKASEEKHEEEETPASQTSTAESTASKTDVAMDEDTVEDAWIKECHTLTPSMYHCHALLLEFMEALYVVLFPTHPSFADAIVNGFSTLRNDAERLFVLDHFEASPPSLLALHDGIIMGSFDDTDKREATDTPSIPKLMNKYWYMRPIKLAEISGLTRPRSNFTILASSLLKILVSLNFPTAFSAEEVSTCLEHAQQIHSEAQALLQADSIFTPEEIARSISITQDLVEYISALS